MFNVKVINAWGEKLSRQYAESLHRERFAVARRLQGKHTYQNKQYISFSSNDYLNLSTDECVKEAFMQAASLYGLGSGSAMVVSGYHDAHAELEEAFATFMRRERALLFNSGYHANLAVMTTLASRHSIFIADKWCHASILDGMQLSHAKYHRYAPLDASHAETLLHKEKQNKNIEHLFLVSESVFGMSGQIAPVKLLAETAKHHDAYFIVDDAHGFGVLGDTGRGITESESLDDILLPCLITPFGKAMGSMGAMVSGNHTLIETLLQFAHTYRYTTALPPAIAKATIKALEILQQDKNRRSRLQHLIQHFIQEAKANELTLISDEMTPVKSILIGDNERVMKIQAALLDDGFHVAAIRPPTVPRHTARLRFSLTAAHEPMQISDVIKKLKHYATLYA